VRQHRGWEQIGYSTLLKPNTKHSDLFDLSSSYNEVSSRGDGDSLDISIVDMDSVLDVEGLVIPDLEVSVPSDGGEVLTSNCSLGGGGDESNLGDTVAVVVFFNDVLAVILDVP
jgi:hypothetical protein